MVIVLAAIVLTVVAIGYALPAAHVAAAQLRVAHPAQQVFRAVADVESYPTWRSDVTRVEMLTPDAGKRWREHGSNGEITFEVVEAQPPLRLVSRIADRDLPFGGSWTFEFTPENGGTLLTITERGEVYNPVFRFMSRFVFGHTATIDQFLADLKKHLG